LIIGERNKRTSINSTSHTKSRFLIAEAHIKMRITDSPSKTDRIFSSLNRICRIALLISSLMLLTSIVLLLVYGVRSYTFDSPVGEIIWPTIIVSGYTLFFSVIMILASLFYYKPKKRLIWSFMKREIALFLLTGCLMTVFYFLNSYTISIL
jgi:hypothetical protein